MCHFTHRLKLLSLDLPSEEQAGVDDDGRPGCLDSCRVDHNGVDAVEVGVDHEWRSAPQVDEILPPIGHVVARPPRLEHKVALQLLADSPLELVGQPFHAGVLRVVHERTDGAQILKKENSVFF